MNLISPDSTHSAALQRLNVGPVLFNEPLAHHCSWRIGGPADVLVEPSCAEQVANAVRYARAQAIPLLVIGQGTNLLFDDAGVRGLVLKLGARMSRIAIDGQRIDVEAGAWVPAIARLAARSGLSGLEHTIGIPGTIGGLVLMNGGSHRKGIGENVSRIWAVDREGEMRNLSREECFFSYRPSALQESGAAIVRVELECPRGDRRLIRGEMIADLRERRRKFPRKEPNCGSVFLSTSEMHASVGPPGKIIEEAGFKGMRSGDAEVSQRHANFIVNRGSATCAEVLTLIGRIRREVQRRVGFELRCEVRYVNPQGKIMPADQADGGRFLCAQ